MVKPTNTQLFCLQKLMFFEDKVTKYQSVWLVISFCEKDMSKHGHRKEEF